MNNSTKLFSEVERKALLESEAFDLGADLQQYAFSVIWEKGPALSLFQLQGTIADNPSKHNIIASAKSDDDGEISIEIGKFKVGTKISLWWGIAPINEDIEKCSVWITNFAIKRSIKLKPVGTGWKAITVGSDWTENESNITLF